ncbi:MAG: MBL fold metallo-hydrolase [Bacteroidota bacterium]|nr:MBL fold metallo-hydrolase [Bacteroidota bacterium]
MEIKFLGYGGAFDYQQGNSSAILKIGSKSILIDCGHSVYPILRKLNKTEEIDYIFITHLHDDHVGSLSSFLIYKKIFSSPVKLVFPDLKFKKTIIDFLSFSLQNPEKYFDFIDIKDVGFADFIDTENFHVKGMQTYSYLFKENHENLVYSGDMNNPEFLIQKLKDKGINSGKIFHDVTFIKSNKAHTFYKDVERLPTNFDVYGYHYNPENKPKDCKLKLVGEQDDLLFNKA